MIFIWAKKSWLALRLNCKFNIRNLAIKKLAWEIITSIIGVIIIASLKIIRQRDSMQIISLKGSRAKTNTRITIVAIKEIKT